MKRSLFINEQQQQQEETPNIKKFKPQHQQQDKQHIIITTTPPTKEEEENHHHQQQEEETTNIKKFKPQHQQQYKQHIIITTPPPTKEEEEEENHHQQQQQQQLEYESENGREEHVIDDDDGDEDAFVNIDENLLYEILKHVDARTLSRAACVSKLWHKTAQDERLWELICTRHWANIGCPNHQLRSVVLALGGFRRLHSHCLLPLSKPHSSAAASGGGGGGSPPTSRSLPWIAAPVIGSKQSAKWGKDEIHLSLSLLSIRYYEKINFCNRRNR